MQIEVEYRTLATVKIEIDDEYKKMVFADDETWDASIRSFSDEMFKKLKENKMDINPDDVMTVTDVETEEIIYEKW